MRVHWIGSDRCTFCHIVGRRSVRGLPNLEHFRRSNAHSNYLARAHYAFTAHELIILLEEHIH